MKVKTPKNSPVAVLYTAAQEIVDSTRKVFTENGRDARELRLPILIHGTDMRITIESGPRIAARNAIEEAQRKATGRLAEPTVDMTAALSEARALLDMCAADLAAANRLAEKGSAEWQRTRAYMQRCVAAASDLQQLERLL